MRGHSQVEHPEMAFKIGGLHASPAQGGFKIVSTMQSLTAGSDFDPCKEQIEAVCGSAAASRCSVERACGERESQDEDSGRPSFLLCKLA
jgi:hypothetical protein